MVNVNRKFTKFIVFTEEASALDVKVVIDDKLCVLIYEGFGGKMQ